jgi:hypothetical protein
MNPHVSPSKKADPISGPALMLLSHLIALYAQLILCDVHKAFLFPPSQAGFTSFLLARLYHLSNITFTNNYKSTPPLAASDALCG